MCEVSRHWSLPSIRLAKIPTLLASAEASSIESADINILRDVHSEQSLTSGNDNSLPNRNRAKSQPHIALHLWIDASRKLINQYDRWISNERNGKR